MDVMHLIAFHSTRNMQCLHLIAAELTGGQIGKVNYRVASLTRI